MHSPIIPGTMMHLFVLLSLSVLLAAGCGPSNTEIMQKKKLRLRNAEAEKERCQTNLESARADLALAPDDEDLKRAVETCEDTYRSACGEVLVSKMEVELMERQMEYYGP